MGCLQVNYLLKNFSGIKKAVMIRLENEEIIANISNEY